MILSVNKNFLGSSPTLFCRCCDTKTLHNVAIIVHDQPVYECSKCGARVQIELVEDGNDS